jgi:hypothetical protein
MKDQAPQVDSSAIETDDSENALNSTTSKRFCLRIAKHLYRLWRERARVFGADADLFCEPAWDILLKLYIASGQGKLLIRTEASMVGLIPQTTGLRILAALKERGLGGVDEFEPVSGGGYMNHAHEAFGELVVARGDGAVDL